MSNVNIVGDASLRGALLTKYNKRDFIFGRVLSHNGKHYTRLGSHNEFIYHHNATPSAIEICEDVLGFDLNTAFSDIILNKASEAGPVDDVALEDADYDLYEIVIQETRIWATIHTNSGFIVALSPDRALTIKLSKPADLYAVGANGFPYVLTKHAQWRMWQRNGLHFDLEMMTKIANGVMEPLGGSDISFNVDFDHDGKTFHARVNSKNNKYHVITIIKNRTASHSKIRKAITQRDRDKSRRGTQMKWVRQSMGGKRRMEPVKKRKSRQYDDNSNDDYDRFA